MPRKPRMYLAGIPAHVVQRGNNRDACFFNIKSLRPFSLIPGPVSDVMVKGRVLS
jgi:REP element-mobilizing transposase RayT